MVRIQMRALVERGVVPILAPYVAGGWGLLQFASLLVDRGRLAGGWVDFILAAWLLLLPAAIFAAWRRAAHAPATPAAEGAPGPEGSSAPLAPPQPAPRSVAVLPFVNLGASAEDACLSEGIGEEILAALARVEGLRVTSRTSVQAYRGKDLDVRTIGRELGVRSVLEGSVQRSGSRLRVSTRLVDAGDGYQLWSGRYDKELADVFAIEDEIAENVARVLRALLRAQGTGVTPRVPRADVRAYEHYLRGRQFFSDSRLKSLRYAREQFQRATEIDAEYALAHAAVAETIALERMFYPARGSDLDAAQRASARALELDPQLAEAHAAAGSVFFVGKRLEDAGREFREALRLDPRCFDALYLYARICYQKGRLEEAAELFARACDVREDYQAAFFAAQSLEALGRTAEAGAMYGRSLRVSETHMELNPDDPRAANTRAVALFRLGRKEEGLVWAERAVAIDPEDAGVRYNAACLYALAGQPERALDLLEEALRAGFRNTEWMRNDPDLASLADEPRLAALLANARQHA